ncbi:1-deoxy-D-xylulose 5-phosphate reductoisomerase [Thioalkalivibrio sp. ALE21]|uniref:1-deoxy-D-xylulose-5-phosphate reductoisomerase n=1 Tax=Thioalkalivibrio sp. ALE21 TaxID=1158175 RepID=UPI000D8F8B7F|nr:1-deoxy-D-xylulose-5-phosphate reductoisomerase [Thioalkalivibrio sp. ALE21]PYG03810.1 1-deoxy-D-xylulose 5-phosphate reductoisomerase [Thioalkalivibrio sp. ALE21]
MNKQQITILGSTGSIGLSTLDVVARQPERFSVYALTAYRNVERMEAQCLQYRPRVAVMGEPEAAESLRDRLAAAGCETKVRGGMEALVEVCRAPEVDAVMAAIVGAAGLLPTLAAAEHGKRVLLANKEALVMSGALLMDAVGRSGARLLPIDSEHNAIFQCLPNGYTCADPVSPHGASRIWLTASGGPFRERSLETFGEITPDEACAHPNWDMGRKISVDSATMMNKGLELVEACWLFAVPPSSIQVVLHPQSIVHSMVAYEDGSVLAQMGNPDMRTPIAHALAWPERMSSGVQALDLLSMGALEFSEPCETRYPALRLAQRALEKGGTATAVLNAANEVAVEAFLAGELAFDAIPALIEATLEGVEAEPAGTLEVVLGADARARAHARDWLDMRRREAV